jgi:hypothetical protein
MRRSPLLRVIDVGFLLLGIAVTIAATNGALHTHETGRTVALGLLAIVFALVTYRAGRSIARDWA